MKQLRILWPWKDLERGQGFFVPCLDTAAVEREGMLRALEARHFDARASVCIRKGLMGVWFFRTHPASSARKKSVLS
jgi:hypothetical protein